MRWRNRGPAYRPGGSTSAAAHVTADCTARAILQASTRIRYPEHAASAHWRRRPEPNRFHRSPDRAATHRRDRHRHEPLAKRVPFRVLDHARPQQQDLRRTPAQLPHPTLGQPRGSHPTALRDESDQDFDRTPGVFTAAWQSASARPKPSPPPPANSLSWSTACWPASSSIMTPAPMLTISSTAPVNSSHCASAPNYSV